MSRSLRIAIYLVVLALGLGLAAPAAADGPTVDDVAKELMCQCGCGMTLPNCSSAMECMVGDQMMDVIRQQIAEGRSKSEIINYFVSIYGEQVLAAPTKEGLNLMVWVTPFATIIGGAGLVGWLLHTWRRRPAAAVEAEAEVEAPPPEGETKLAHYEQMVEQELEELE